MLIRFAPLGPMAQLMAGAPRVGGADNSSLETPTVYIGAPRVGGADEVVACR